MILAALGTANSIENNLRTRQPSRLGTFMLGILMVDSAVIIWVYFLGGWQFWAGL
jgi:hypothetical protein